MNSRQLAERIGNIDERLLKQSLEMPNRKRLLKRNNIKKIVALAAVICAMVCSGAVGALAFSEETVVKVPVKMETLELEEIGLTLILPDSWEGRYAVERDKSGAYNVYNPVMRENFGVEDSGGILFYILRIDEVLTADQVGPDSEYYFAANRYLFATDDSTYLLYYASDVQFTQYDYEEYDEMSSQIKDIKIVVNDILSGE